MGQTLVMFGKGERLRHIDWMEGMLVPCGEKLRDGRCEASSDPAIYAIDAACFMFVHDEGVEREDLA